MQQWDWSQIKAPPEKIVKKFFRMCLENNFSRLHVYAKHLKLSKNNLNAKNSKNH